MLMGYFDITNVLLTIGEHTTKYLELLYLVLTPGLCFVLEKTKHTTWYSIL